MAAKLLTDATDRVDLLERLQRVRPETPRRWGRMTAPQMICHLTGAFRGVMGERLSSSPPPVIPRWRQRIIKFFALQLPISWPRGMKTRPDIDQERGGTPPRTFRAMSPSWCVRSSDLRRAKGPGGHTTCSGHSPTRSGAAGVTGMAIITCVSSVSDPRTR